MEHGHTLLPQQRMINRFYVKDRPALAAELNADVNNRVHSEFWTPPR
ncbi:hypothetical protein CA13_67730 [Planctomycetes bacterium CA13]|uniref:Uncharacterized protein n=1 Tax=Novipirellula herctigrandis TaxID=2527986 RepID=A0A5C5YNB0_9BACT|nr:hypothetical protein CA13_67730 [Planctomycetes bacterium CA13]